MDLKFLFFVLLVIGVSFVLCNHDDDTTSAPDLTGRWDDTVCNLIPNSRQIYRRRSYLFGTPDTTYLNGTFEITTQYFPEGCDATEEQGRSIFYGSYKLIRENALQGFWNINYRLNDKTFQVFTAGFAAEIESYENCDLEDIQVSAVMSIKYTNCVPLHFVPINTCPIIYDIVRKDLPPNNRTMWVGLQDVGMPPVWTPPCSQGARPQLYDRYSLSLYDPYFGQGGGSYVNQFLDFGYANDYDQQGYFDDIFQTSQIAVVAENSASQYVMSFGLVMIALFMLF